MPCTSTQCQCILESETAARIFSFFALGLVNLHTIVLAVETLVSGFSYSNYSLLKCFIKWCFWKMDATAKSELNHKVRYACSFGRLQFCF